MGSSFSIETFTIRLKSMERGRFFFFFFFFCCNKSHGIILNLVCASMDPYDGVFRHFYLELPVSSLDVVTLYKDSHASGKRFVSNLRC